MSEKSLDTIFSGFDPSKPAPANRVAKSELKAVTIWVPAECKTSYDRLQRSTRRGFSKKIRELFQAAIDMAESRARSSVD